jgi:LPS-assembly protein
MRAARKPRAEQGVSDVPDRRHLVSVAGRFRASCARVFAASLALVLCVIAPAGAFAQRSGEFSQKAASPPSAFPKPEGGIFGPTPKYDNTLPLYLQGDQLIYDTKGNRVVAKGNVEIFYNSNILTADEVIYDQGANTLSASGNVVLKEANGNIIRAERYTLTDDFRDGFVQSLSVVSKDNTRIAAEQGARRDGNTTEFSNGRFTPCSSEGGMPPLWCISASKITHDTQAASITYQDAQFELFGQPVFYMPYFEHPDPSVKRRSGFLAPSFGNSDDLGFFTETPYFFAMAPNYDFTFRPRYMTEQGVLWQGDWRHKLWDGQYSVKLAGIDQNASGLPAGSDTDLEGWRGSIETKGDFSLSSWWRAGWDVTLESDDSFRRFYKLDNILLTDRVNIYMEGLSDRNYFGANLYQFTSLLPDPPSAESRTYPIIDYNYVFGDPVLGGELKWDTNLLAFSRLDLDQADNPALIGKNQVLNRAVTELKWRRRLTDMVGITYTPIAELRGDLYQFANYTDAITGEYIEDESKARGLATGGVLVAYPWIANTTSASHTIEPIGQVIARQASVTQGAFPNEDAKSLIFDDTNLFEPSKFSGYDRLETGTRANVGVQYTFQAFDGSYARVLAGQSFQLAGDNAYTNQLVTCVTSTGNTTEIAPGLDAQCNPVFNPRSGLESDTSDYVLGLYLAPTDAFRIISQSRFDDNTVDLRREDFGAIASYGPLFAQATYTYAFNDPELGEDSQQEAIGSLGMQLTDRWSVLGRLRYDIDVGERLLDSVQLRYLDDCFMLSATYQESFITDAQQGIEPDRTIMLRFELKHLGGFAYSTNVLDHIYGDQQTPQ